MTLPTVITRYFDAANRFNATEAAECFTDDALVHDENQDHIGRNAIRAWIQNTSDKYHPAVEIQAYKIEGSSISLTARISGPFPGSPIELDYRIEVAGDRISELIIE